MKRRIPPLLAVFVLLLFLQSAYARAPMRASLDGLQEVPPNGSAGTGDGRFIIDTNTNTLFYFITFGGLVGAETAAHIHGYAPAGVNAGVVHALPAGSPKIGAWNYPEANEAQIVAGLTYVNVHTAAFPGGEIRGQVLPDPMTNMVALCEGAQEVPPTASAGLGIAFFHLDTVANTLGYNIVFGNLTAAETAAHIHGFAPPGVNGGVLHALPLGTPKVGTWNFTDAQEPNIVAGLTYVNIHTGMFPGGEIRGQVVMPTPATDVPQLPVRAADLSLVAAPNPVRSDGGGVALFYRLPEAGEVTVTIHDVAGRKIRSIHSGRAEATGIFAWDVKDDAGAPVSAGVYFARLHSAAGSETRTITVLK